MGISVFYYKEAEADSIIQVRGGDTVNIHDDDQICSFSVTTFSLDGERLDYNTITTMDCKDMEEYVFKHIGDISVYYRYRNISWYDEKAFFCIRETSNSDNEENTEDESTEEIYSTEEPSQEENVEQNQHSNDDYYPSNDSYENQDMNNGSYRPECRACRGKGDCFVCEGRGYTHTKRVYNNSLGCWDLVDEPCHSCGNTGKCTACKGDGFLDEGIDY